MKDNYDFKSRRLYEQKCKIDDQTYVASAVYAVSYTYPGALTQTSARCRTTFVYMIEGLTIQPTGGTIEKWSDKGWQVIDEFFDTRLILNEEEEIFSYMLSLFKSFILGMPIEYSKKYDHVPEPPPDAPEKKTHLRVLSFKDKLSSEKEKQTPKPSPSGSDDSDFDWI